MHKAAVLLTALALAFSIYAMVETYEVHPEWFGVSSFWSIAVVGIMLVAHLVRPARPWSIWGGIAASAYWGGFGRVVYLLSAFFERSLLVDEWKIAVFTVPAAVLSILSLFRRRKKPAEANCVR